jgi:hypothetical protein
MQSISIGKKKIPMNIVLGTVAIAAVIFLAYKLSK